MVLEQLQSLQELEKRVNAIEIASVYDFSRYTFQEEELKYNLQSSKKTLERNGSFLHIFKLALKIRIASIRLATCFANSFKTLAIDNEEVARLEKDVIGALMQLKEFHQKIDYRTQIRSLVTIRRNLFESYNLISLIREASSKNKKVKAVKPQI